MVQQGISGTMCCSRRALCWDATCYSPMFCHFVTGVSHAPTNRPSLPPPPSHTIVFFQPSALIEGWTYSTKLQYSIMRFFLTRDLTEKFTAMHRKFSKFRLVRFALTSSEAPLWPALNVNNRPPIRKNKCALVGSTISMSNPCWVVTVLHGCVCVVKNFHFVVVRGMDPRQHLHQIIRWQA